MFSDLDIYTMKQLIVIRHAKSSWEFPIQDFDRVLTPQGIKDANLVATSIVNHLPVEYVVWSSQAKRAMETATIFAHTIKYPLSQILFKRDLYTFDESSLEKIIKSCPEEINCLIVFGHNEAITNFVNKFGDVYIDNVPTSGFVHISFATSSWKNITKGKIQKTVFPRDLK